MANPRFALKFGRIVQEEKDANFITQLHSGKLNIIPWPVIGSPEFYTLFPMIKRRLDGQETAHKTAGEFLLTMKTLMAKLKATQANDWGSMSQTLAAHRAKTVGMLLKTALQTGYTETVPQREPLKNLDSDNFIDMPDSDAVFFLSDHAMSVEQNTIERESMVEALIHCYKDRDLRQKVPDVEFVGGLVTFLNGLAETRINRVRYWLDTNLSRFQAGHASIEELYRTLANATIDLHMNVQLCKVQCTSCGLLCIQSRFHGDSSHDCKTNHSCIHTCWYCDHDMDSDVKVSKPCGMPAGHAGQHICMVDTHLCGTSCTLLGKQGCMEQCTKASAMVGHSDEHMCPASVHMCGMPCDLRDIRTPTGKTYSCKNLCRIAHHEPHTTHECETRLCPVRCQLCSRLCQEPHMHGTQKGVVHLCGEEHSCSALCAADGICEINTTPQSVEAMFTGKNETFQYTKYTQAMKRKNCVKVIERGHTEHDGPHSHDTINPFHFCNVTCTDCGYYCILPFGHSQQEHETSHGSMSGSTWSVQGPESTSVEVNGRKFSAGDDGAPMMCNMICLSMGRHVHHDYCRATDGKNCENADIRHLTIRMHPNPDQPKDAITHSLHWRRKGGSIPPSFCTLPMFHPPTDPGSRPTGLGYISNDGHAFSCDNPVALQQAFHVIFVIDRSFSMSASDRMPLVNTPCAARIRQSANNRLGAVFSALYGFWSSRHAAFSGGSTASRTVVGRRDAYSVVAFNHEITLCLLNDFTSSPDELLDRVLPHHPRGDTDFNSALSATQEIMAGFWSTDRKPVIVFLSDGECNASDEVIRETCRLALCMGKPLSFHAISFGADSSSSSLRRMANIALEIQNSAPADLTNVLGDAMIPSSYSIALDTVALSETFLSLAESLRKPRASLLH
ncbi:hypothetical protein K488DRAFT_76563 [Vararia minispora EC-137]|uniref:Uncharacterized protein n=1 Tax=Vararia minispora EC-137 TaxID=1314806 RepID=A0ACB8QV26_9AGAM|nr:hypothetical protein K488DRAFT_76563 [Vararia minispora EC-137]